MRGVKVPVVVEGRRRRKIAYAEYISGSFEIQSFRRPSLTQNRVWKIVLNQRWTNISRSLLWNRLYLLHVIKHIMVGRWVEWQKNLMRRFDGILGFRHILGSGSLFWLDSLDSLRYGLVRLTSAWHRGHIFIFKSGRPPQHGNQEAWAKWITSLRSGPLGR